ncbi:MAG: serine/threonine-protein phosphatase [Deltaproteobacteria bacterium]|nr:serine/threonine-protein phosphatase [Deltaproteobacteria bacterium]
MKVQVFGQTDTGKLRSGNEDSILVAPQFGLGVVCDGMGGHEAGEVASKTAVDSIFAWFNEGGDDGSHFGLDPALPGAARRLASAILYADQAIRTAAQVPGRQGMGTTVVAAMVDGNTLYVGHAGDSRAYMGRGRAMMQVTQDHSVVGDLLRAGIITEAQAVHVKKNAITRALGVTDNLVVDVDAVAVQPGDTFLLCSDGLHGLVPDEAIGAHLCGGQELPDSCRNLIDAANAAGGSDNISTVLLRVEA